MSEKQHVPAPPAPDEVVEVIDPHTGYRLTAAVETADSHQHVLRFDLGAPIPLEAILHWDDGDLGWQTRGRLELLEESLASWHIPPSNEWEPAPVRRSLRTPVGNAPMLVRIIESAGLREGQRIHVVCLDVSDSGCRASWPGQPPLEGDTVEVAWEVDNRHDASDPQWIRARVARITALPFGARHVGLKFQIADSAQAARIRDWTHDWLQEHRRRALDRHSR